MNPGSDMAYGSASSLTLAERWVSRSITSRRVGSDKAQNTWSSTAASAIRFPGLSGPAGAAAAAC
jgi:hypothetical protein